MSLRAASTALVESYRFGRQRPALRPAGSYAFGRHCIYSGGTTGAFSFQSPRGAALVGWRWRFRHSEQSADSCACVMWAQASRHQTALRSREEETSARALMRSGSVTSEAALDPFAPALAIYHAKTIKRSSHTLASSQDTLKGFLHRLTRLPPLPSSLTRAQLRPTRGLRVIFTHSWPQLKRSFALRRGRRTTASSSRTVYVLTTSKTSTLWPATSNAS